MLVERNAINLLFPENTKLLFNIEIEDENYQLSSVINFNTIFSDGLTIQAKYKNYEIKFYDTASHHNFIRNQFNQSDTVLLIDKNVCHHYQQPLQPHMLNSALILDISEQNKALDYLTTIFTFLSNRNVGKSGALTVVGGGISQDLGGFAAACYKRGVNWIYIPTTLLAMSDSCLGGKVSLNFGQAKNQLGLFSNPSQIIIDIGFLKTLANQDISSGLAEILKACVIGGDHFLKLYQSCVSKGVVTNFGDYLYLIAAALSVKKAVIEKDEFEVAERKVLNYGHTVGHAIEVLSNYTVPHGLAVAAGMLIANEMSFQHGLLDEENFTLLNTLSFDLLDTKMKHNLSNINLRKQQNEFKALLLKDKKLQEGLLTFILLKKPGEMVLKKITINDALVAQLIAIYERLFVQ